MDKSAVQDDVQPLLRIVPPEELYADIQDEETADYEAEEGAKTKKEAGGVEYDIVGEDGQLIMRTNREILDKPSSQAMTMKQIEDLKAKGVSGKDLVSKILDSHSALDQKTAFALSKYTLRKTRKYIKRFTVLPLDVSTLAGWIYNDREPMKIMEIREEILALIGSWSNLHYTAASLRNASDLVDEGPSARRGRWLLVDETSGLLIAFVAEKLGILHPPASSSEGKENRSGVVNELGGRNNGFKGDEIDDKEVTESTSTKAPSSKNLPNHMNTIHLVHPASQPNLSLLKYFHFDANDPSPHHPLTRHVKTLSWLQLLSPREDPGYTKPEEVAQETVKTWKAGRRSNYYKKWRRWERIRSTVDETRDGGFDGLIVASVMKPVTILRELVPLLRGGAQVVLYNRAIEPLAELADSYSTSRRTAFLMNPPDPMELPNEDFAVDPTLLLGTAIHTARARSWQTLPGRTHPLMMGRGGTDGYIFVGTRVLPAEGKIMARGQGKRRKLNTPDEATEEGNVAQSEQGCPDPEVGVDNELSPHASVHEK